MTDPIEKLTNHLIERKTVQVAEKPPNDDDHVNLGEELFPIHIDDVPAPEIPVDFRALTQYDAETILTPTLPAMIRSMLIRWTTDWMLNSSRLI